LPDRSKRGERSTDPGHRSSPVRGCALDGSRAKKTPSVSASATALTDGEKLLAGRSTLAAFTAALAAGSLLAAAPVVLLGEALHPAGGVDELHLACEEGMAGRADFDRDVLLGAARGELVAATAGHGGLDILGVNAFFHGSASAAWGHVFSGECIILGWWMG